MKKFNYTMNHKADEAYMAKMCRAGWAAKGLVEGFWTFEPCKPGQYTYRVCYLRGKSCEDIRRPMVIGSVLSWAAFLVCLFFVIKVSAWFIILSVVLAVYAVMCTCLAASYSKLIRKLKICDGQF